MHLYLFLIFFLYYLDVQVGTHVTSHTALRLDITWYVLSAEAHVHLSSLIIGESHVWHQDLLHSIQTINCKVSRLWSKEPVGH